MLPTIIHADLDAFFASVEQRDDPALRGRPVIVGGGVVLAASYEARAFGVRGAMGGRRARELCPDAIVVRPRIDAYSAASKAVFAVFRDTSPVVEGLSIDEAFLDVRGMAHMAGTAAEIGACLRRRVRDEVGLALTVGVARTKHLAKVASAAAKPDGLLVVPADPASERAFLHPLAVEAVWGVGPKTAERLHRAGIHRVGELAAADPDHVVALLGRAAGLRLHALANNRDTRPVRTGRRRRSIGSQSALGRRRRTEAELDAILVALADRLGRRLRAAGMACRTVTLRLRFDDYTRATRSTSVDRSTRATDTILRLARELLAEARPLVAARGLTLIGLALTNLRDDDGAQLELPLGGSRAGLDDALDAVRDRFGNASVRRAVNVHRDIGPAMPVLPDRPDER
ncbi:DNA polymerase IV [Paraconexibacter antarcticus]|uniref:DNA polymerase IV n=1 Tax=Paraconexibacter antarcticus TaxID=2949664 RepID=A0ABY5DS83_9ACTN|nr:DNA polymerase IV [Paraconexibacter antarcticus]UTI63555.1 DNA polymerase IV [Paraconexibacter antarcticus]